MYSCCIIVQGRGIVTGVTESQCRESVKEEYKGITLYLGIFTCLILHRGMSTVTMGNHLVMFGSREKRPVVIIALYMVAKLAYRERTK